MADPYRIQQEPELPRAGRHAAAPRQALRPALWVALIVSAAANVVSSSIGLHVLVGSVFGLLTVACAAALTVHHYRHRGR